jgi:LCP family protein required for cell wall assembly
MAHSFRARRKLLVVPIIVVLLLCGAANYLGSLRPFAPASTAARYLAAEGTPAEQISLESSPTPGFAPDPSDEPPTSAPAGSAAPGSEADQTTTPAPHAAELTETAVPAEKTLGSIDARAHATWAPTAGPSLTPRPINMTTNILLMGTDQRPNDPTWVPATDVMMVLFVDTTNERVALLSIPRDLVVAIPRHGAFRINYVYQYGLRARGPTGGAELVMQVLHDEFNIRIDHWAVIDLTGFQKIIDTVGGIDVRVACPLEDTIDNQHFVIPAGQAHMDYLTAKRYVQSRYSTSDTSRNFRQQRVIWAIAKKAFQLNALDRLPTLWNQLHDSVQTDMTMFDMISLIPAAYSLDLKDHPERVRASVLDSPAVYPYVANYGAWLFMPDYSQTNMRLDNLFDSPEIAPAAASPAECPRTGSAASESAGVTPTPPP